MKLLNLGVVNINYNYDASGAELTLSHDSALTLGFNSERATCESSLTATFTDVNTAGESMSIRIKVACVFECPTPDSEDVAFEKYCEAYDVLYPYMQERYNILAHLLGSPPIQLPKAVLSREKFNYIPPVE